MPLPAGIIYFAMSLREEERIYTVGEVNRMADELLQGLVLWVEGEVSNFKAYPNYAFFSLSEEEAILPCVMFKEAMDSARFDLREGSTILARGRLGVYIRRGQYRMNVYEAEEAGEGRLRREFLRLMRKLSKEGLFDERVKKPLPPYPERVGLITSLEGAAIRDVVTNLTRRFRGVRLMIRGVRVQGEEAAADIVEALELFNASCPVDVLILARGGGSLEDLQPFNTEEVVRAIRASSIPVVTGVGHEPDLTLADLAADFRASTPTGAAEAVAPSYLEILSMLREREVSFLAHARRGLQSYLARLDLLEKRRPFSDPSLLVAQASHRLADGEARLLGVMRSTLADMERRVDGAAFFLARYPREYRELPERIEDAASRLASTVAAWLRWREREPDLRARELRAAALIMLERENGVLRLASSRLEALSPLAVLSRGYSITTRWGERKPLTDSDEVEVGDEVGVSLHRGALRCEVREKRR
jgi:exodeoxyribonuclease VII large subunit